MHVRRIFRQGHSAGVVMPPELLREMQWTIGMHVYLEAGADGVLVRRAPELEPASGRGGRRANGKARIYPRGRAFLQ